MPTIEIKSAYTTLASQANPFLANQGTLTDIYFSKWLDTPGILAFSETCLAARNITSDFKKRHILKNN